MEDFNISENIIIIRSSAYRKDVSLLYVIPSKSDEHKYYICYLTEEFRKANNKRYGKKQLIKKLKNEDLVIFYTLENCTLLGEISNQTHRLVSFESISDNPKVIYEVMLGGLRSWQLESDDTYKKLYLFEFDEDGYYYMNYKYLYYNDYIFPIKSIIKNSFITKKVESEFAIKLVKYLSQNPNIDREEYMTNPSKYFDDDSFLDKYDDIDLKKLKYNDLDFVSNLAINLACMDYAYDNSFNSEFLHKLICSSVKYDIKDYDIIKVYDEEEESWLYGNYE